MPNFVYSKIKMWFLPCLFILICAIIISYIVTINKNDSKEQIYEGLTIPGNISTSNVSS